MVKLTIKDKKILYELDSNARQNNTTIAKKVGLSKDAVGYRINQLEKKGIIKGYRTLFDLSKLNYIQYRIAFKLINVTEEKINHLIGFLQKESIVWGIAHNEGEWDFGFTSLVKSVSEFHKFYNKLMASLNEDIIKEKMISQIIKYEELNRNYLLNIKRKPYTIPLFNEELKKIDELDKQILQYLGQNGRIKLIDLATKTNQSSMLIHQRIKKLEGKKIIIGYKVDLNVLAIERDYYGIKINLNKYNEKNKILSEIYSLKETSAILYTVGGYDIEFDIEVKDTSEFHKIINNLRNKFSSIKEIKHIRAMEYYKLKHIPKIK